MSLARLLAVCGCLVSAVAFSAPPPKEKEPEPEEPTCSLGLDMLHAQFVAKPPKGVKVSPGKLDKKARRYIQEAQLADGTRVRVTVGGCEHVSVVLELRPAHLTTRTVGGEVVAQCKRLLPQVPADKDALLDPKLFLKAIDEAAINALPIPLPCGDSRCELALEPDEVKKPAKPPKGKPADTEPPAFIRLSFDQAI